jgi:amino acid adenylation domain-containing protein
MPANAHPAQTFVPFDNTAIDQSLCARFEQQVASHPNRPAVVSTNWQFSYSELNKVANGIARAVLSHLGESEEPVALLFEEGAFIIAAVLGILKAGKIYVPLDPAFPHERMAYMLENSQARFLLTNTKHLSRAQQVARAGQKILNCDDIDINITAGNLDRPISAEAGAVLFYTSGSTGRPKGVLHNHRNILVETRNYTNDVKICPEDKLSQCHSSSFVNSIRNIYGALLNGATLLPYDLASEGIASLAEWIRLHRITIFHTVPTTFRRLLDTVEPAATFPTVRILRIGGEPINNNDVKRFQRHFSPHCALMHVIGPTETLTIRRFFITRDWRSNDGKVPVGYAVPDKEVVVLDETGRDVGADQIGEIAVKSKYLAVGYWRRPDLTQTAFIPDPRGGDERLYRTGDLGLMRPDGCLIHMGRKDFQLKIHGYRVEVAEVEEALLDVDSIEAAVVHAQADNTEESRLIAYVVPASDVAPTVSDLRRALAQTLPDFMIPSAFVFLEALPLSPTGKIDRQALPAPNHTRPALNVRYVAPRTRTESDLARIWAEVLELKQVGVHDHFLELGGDSLRATRILSRVTQAFRVELTIQALLEAPTIEQMAELIGPH